MSHMRLEVKSRKLEFEERFFLSVFGIVIIMVLYQVILIVNNSHYIHESIGVFR